MAKRGKMDKRKSRKVFKKTVDRTHRFNKQDRSSAGLKRGGIRL